MTGRSLNATHATNYNSASPSELVFVYLDFSSGVVRVHNGVGTISWGGNDWLGVGEFGKISILEEGVEIRALRVKMTLSGLDSGLVNTAMTEDYHWRSAIIYKATLAADNTLAADPDLYWGGRMDHMVVTLDQGTGLVELVAENRLASYNVARPQRSTLTDHQEEFAGDLFYEYQPQLQDYSVSWGGAVIRSYNNASPGYGGTPGSNSMPGVVNRLP